MNKYLVAIIGTILLIIALGGNRVGEYSEYIAIPILVGAVIILLSYVNRKRKNK